MKQLEKAHAHSFILMVILKLMTILWFRQMTCGVLSGRGD